MNPESEQPEIKVQLSPEQYLNHLVDLTAALLKNPVFVHEDCGHLLTVAEQESDDPEDTRAGVLSLPAKECPGLSLSWI